MQNYHTTLHTPAESARWPSRTPATNSILVQHTADANSHNKSAQRAQTSSTAADPQNS